MLSVVFYHANVPGFGGGYVGVDVFFVISGYLITALLFREFEETGHISLSHFFLRRIRRLAPALFAVLMACLIAGFVWLSPVGGELQGLAKSTLATLGLASNVYFWRHTGDYFDAPAETHPLLHMWSLSVEEQFYLVWPWLIILVARAAVSRGRPPRRAVFVALGVVLAASLAACIALTPAQPPLTFFMTPFRAWEFAAGGAVFFALSRVRASPSVASALAASGLLAILSAVHLFERETAFPGWRAALPVFGSAAVLLGCEMHARSLTARLLSLRSMVAIGLISYSLYLWHWPVLVYARMATIEPLGLGASLLLCLLSVGLAWATFAWVEDPIRRGRYPLMVPTRRALWASAAMVAMLVVTTAAMGYWAKFVWPNYGNHRAEAEAILQAGIGYEVCSQSRPYSGRLLETPRCVGRRGADAYRTPEIMLWGDSHAAHLVPAILAAGDALDQRVLVRSHPECLPLNGANIPAGTPRYRESCWHFNRDVVSALETSQQLKMKTLVLAARWRAYAQYPEIRGPLGRELHATLQWAVDRDMQVIIVAPVPEFEFSVPSCLIRRSEEECGVSRKVSEKERVIAMELLRNAARGVRGVRIIDPFAILCGDAVCPPRTPESVLYFDSHHLSLQGSEALTAWLTQALSDANHAAEPSKAKFPAGSTAQSKGDMDWVAGPARSP